MIRFLPRLMRALALALLAAAPASAQQAVVPVGVDAQVRSAVAEEWGVAPERLVLEFGAPPRGGLPDADGDLEVQLMGSGTGGHWVVRLTTPQGEGDAVSVRVRVGVETLVLVAAQELKRGQVLSQLDLGSAQEVQWGEPVRPEPLPEVGWVVQRLIRRGEPLRSPAVQPPLAVVSGKPVALVWQRDGVGIRMKGRAVGSAPMGGQVFVRTESGERLEGVAVAPGVVDVTPAGDLPR